jgi:hypothetical protein
MATDPTRTRRAPRSYGLEAAKSYLVILRAWIAAHDRTTNKTGRKRAKKPAHERKARTRRGRKPAGGR